MKRLSVLTFLFNGVAAAGQTIHMRADQISSLDTSHNDQFSDTDVSFATLIIREITSKLPLELCVLLGMVIGFMLFRKSDGKWWTSVDGNAQQSLSRRLEKSIHRNFHTGRPTVVLEVFAEVREKKCWLSRVALELVLRSMVQENAVDAPALEQYIRHHYPKEKEQVRIITTLVETCASRMHLDCIVEIIKAREATGAPFTLARLGTYLSVLGAFAGAGREQEVTMILDAIEVSEGSIPHRAFVVGIMGMLKGGSLWAALRLMRQMEAHRLTVPHQCLVSLFNAGAEKNEVPALMDQMLTLNTPLPPDALYVLAKCALDSDDVDFAERLMVLNLEHRQTSKSESMATKPYMPLLTLYAKQQNLRALDVFEVMFKEAHKTGDLCLDVFQVCKETTYRELLRTAITCCKATKYWTADSPYAPRLFQGAVAACDACGMTEEAANLKQAADAQGLGICGDLTDCYTSPHSRRALEEFRQSVAREPSARHDYSHHLRLAAEYADSAYAAEVLETMRAKFGPTRCCEGAGSPLSQALAVFVRANQLQAGFAVLCAYSANAEAEAWNVLLTAYCASGNAEAARKCWVQMDRSPAVPNDASHNCYLGVLLWDYAFEEAKEFLVKMQQKFEVTGATVATLTRALQSIAQEQIPDSASYRDVRNTLQQAQTSGQVAFTAAAANAIGQARKEDLTDDVTKAVINACAALDVHREMALLLPILPRSHIAAHMAVMKAYAAIGQVEQVLTAWVEMTKEKKLIPSQVALGQVLNVLASNGRPAAAQAMLLEWKDVVEPNCVMYTTVIKGLARAKDFDRAMEVWAQMKKDGVEPNVKAYNTLLDACARAGHIDTHGKLILAEMAEKKIPVASVTVSTAVKGYCNKGLLAEAAASLGEALNGPLGDGQRANRSSTDASAYNALLDGCVKAGDFVRFDATYAEMLRQGVKPSSFTLTALVKRYGNAGMLDTAFDTVDQVCAEHGSFLRNLHVSTCLISASFRNKSPQRAFKYFDSMQAAGLQPDAVTFATVIHGTKFMPQEAGLELAVRYSTQALVSPGPGLPDYALVDLVERMAAAGVLATTGMQLVKTIEATGSAVPRAITNAISRKVAASVGVNGKGGSSYQRGPHRSPNPSDAVPKVWTPSRDYQQNSHNNKNHSKQNNRWD